VLRRVVALIGHYGKQESAATHGRGQAIVIARASFC
jgi:hypothetical protein